MSKKLKVSDKCKNVEKVDGELVLSIKKLREIQDELKKVNEEESDKTLEIQQTYSEIRKPMYDKRNDLINTIPNFWLTGFLLHPGLCGLLNKEDRNIFKYLRSLEVEDHKNVNSGYSITFNFNLNPYFKDTKIVKTINFLEEGTTKVTATPIKWKEGKEYPNGVIQKKKGNKRHPSNNSFFSWFGDTELKKDEIAEIIKEDLWPKSLDYFYKEYLDETYEKNEADDMEKDDDDDDSDNVEKNDNNYDDDDDQEDDDEEEE